MIRPEEAANRSVRRDCAPGVTGARRAFAAVRAL